MRSVSFLVALLFALVTTTYAWPEAKFLEARKGGQKNNNGTMDGNGNGNSVNRSCRKMAKLEKLTSLANNQTALDAMVAKGKLNSTEVEEIKAKAANATAELQTMQSNTTLVQECAVVDAHMKVVGQCKAMKQLSKMANLANNATALAAFEAKKNLTDTEKTKLQEMVANATTKLQELQSNTTLTDLCSAQQKAKSGDGASSTNAATQAQATGGSSKSTSAAAGLSAQTAPYLFVPLLAGVFALLL